MNQRAVDGLLLNVTALLRACQEEKLDALAGQVGGIIAEYHKTNETPASERTAIDWQKLATQLETRAAELHRENAALPPAARNTPFGVMTGTATLILSLVAEAISVAQGEPPQAMVNEFLARLQADRSNFIMSRLGMKAP